MEWQERPLAGPGPGQARIRTAAVGICATDLEMIAGSDRTGFPCVLGHEWSGIVDAVGENVDTALVGQLCVAENVLADGGEIGFEHPGAYGECFLTEARCIHPLPASFSASAAVLIEPLAVCMRGMRRLRLDGSATALVFGDGPIGLMMQGLLKQAGVECVALIGGRPARLSLARELGADITINYHEVDGPASDTIRRLLPHAPTVVIEASGSGSAVQAAIDTAAREAKILVLGDYGSSRAGFPWNQLLHKEVELIGSNAGEGAWDSAVEMAIGGGFPLDRLVSQCLPAASFAEAIELAQTSRDMMKVVVEWERGSSRNGLFPVAVEGQT